MAQSKILVDTNSYFRLAKSIHPLLFVEFGSPSYCLYVIPELDVELRRNPALQTKFAWAAEEEYASNRKRYPTLSRKELSAVQNAYDFIWNHVQEELPGPSRVDAKNLAYGYVLNIPVITDDRDMRELAKVFDVRTMVSLELAKLMCDCDHIQAKKVKEMFEYWRYWNDLPYNAQADFVRLFGDLTQSG
jgi:hypothetical protein